MKVIDYNGTGRWSAAEIMARYARYAKLAQLPPRDLSPRVRTSGCVQWIYPVIDEVIKGIKTGDPACIRIGIEFIEEDRRFSFGSTLKSNAARALKRVRLTGEQKQRLIERVFGMLARGVIPREYRDYASLANRIGFRAEDVQEVDEGNPYAVRFRRYFLEAAAQRTRVD